MVVVADMNPQALRQVLEGLSKHELESVRKEARVEFRADLERSFGRIVDEHKDSFK